MKQELKTKIQILADKYLLPFDLSYSLYGSCCASITPAEGEFMYDFILSHKLQNGIEIGTGPGYSGLYLGSAMKKFYTVDNGAIGDTINWTYDKVYEHWQKLYGDMGMGDVKFLKHLDIAGLPKDFDFVFIDGNHTGEFPLNDFNMVQPFLLPKHYIFFHDTEGHAVQDAIFNAIRKGYHHQSIQFPDSVGHYGLTVVWR
jgi:hypothetical protein